MVSPDYEAIVTDRFKDDLTAEVIWRLENAGQSSAERLIRPNVRCLSGLLFAAVRAEHAYASRMTCLTAPFS